MELKPIKEKSEILYPTSKEEQSHNNVKDIVLVATVVAPQRQMILPIAVPIYYVAPSYEVPVLICHIAQIVFAVTAIVSSILLIVNKAKIKKCQKEYHLIEKLKRHKKIEWWIFGVSIALIIIASILAICFEKIWCAEGLL